MTAANDHRRAGRLRADALAQAVAFRGTGLTPRERAVLTMSFLLYAAHLWPKEYSAAETQRVLARFHDTAARLAVTGTD